MLVSRIFLGVMLYNVIETAYFAYCLYRTESKSNYGESTLLIANQRWGIGLNKRMMPLTAASVVLCLMLG